MSENGNAGPDGLNASEPTIEKWKELFDVADKLKKGKPWRYLGSDELVLVMLKGMEEPYVWHCSIFWI